MMSDIKRRLRFHGRFGSEDNTQQAARKAAEREEAADHIERQEALIAELRKDAAPKLIIALPDYEKRRIVIGSDELIDGERILCVAIVDPDTSAQEVG